MVVEDIMELVIGCGAGVVVLGGLEVKLLASVVVLDGLEVLILLVPVVAVANPGEVGKDQ